MKLLQKYMKYVAYAALILFLSGLLFSPSFRTDVKMWTAVVFSDAVGRMEAQVDQGELALKRYENIYIKEMEKVQILHKVIKDYQVSLDREVEAVAQCEREGREDLATMHRKQVDFLKQKLEMAERRGVRKLESLRNIKTICERGKLDVTLAKERIALLAASREVMDDAGMEEELAKAEKNISNMKSSCNKLEAEVEILYAMED